MFTSAAAATSAASRFESDQVTATGKFQPKASCVARVMQSSHVQLQRRDYEYVWRR